MHLRTSLRAAFAAIALCAACASAEILPGLEMYGPVTLVDSIECAAEHYASAPHRFREFPAGRSYVTNILGSQCVAMAHVRKSETPNGNESGSFISWRLGEGKGLVPNDPYLMVIDYPDDAPRSVTVMNFGNGTRHGYHTGFTVGESMSPPYVSQSLESWAVPLSGEYRQLVSVFFPYETSAQYDGSSSKLDMATDGFDIDFALLAWEDATDSVGVAVKSIRLYKINSYEAAKPEFHYPTNAPIRLITSRDEMGDNDWKGNFADPSDFYIGRAKHLRLLGMNTSSKDLLEFGYEQNWGGNWVWSAGSPNWWPQILSHLRDQDINVLPYYEYHGSRGYGGHGYKEAYKPWTLNSAANPDWKYLFSNQSYVYGCMADITLPETEADLIDLMDKTIIEYKDQANFVGAWIRSRGGMPISFSTNAIGHFNRETGRNVTRADIYNNGNYSGTQLYKDYRAWWYLKRRDLFCRLQEHLEGNGIGDAKFFYHSCIGEPGEFWAGWANKTCVFEGNAADGNITYNGQTWAQMTGLSGVGVGAYAGYWYKDFAIDADWPTWGNYEIHHSAPADDYRNYGTNAAAGLSFPMGPVGSVVADYPTRDGYRNKNGDLFFVRHYSLNENNLSDHNGNRICGYFTTDMERAGRAVMLSELWAMCVNDPTMLGYLYGSNLERLDAPFVREFNLNFLSLPAQEGRVLSGGTWNCTTTVRKYETADGDYWAVINPWGHPITADFNLDTSKARVWRTVSYAQEEVSGGSVRLTLEPYQMVCFTDIQPPVIPEPTISSATADRIMASTADISVVISALGDGSTSATVDWVLSGGDAAAASGQLVYAIPDARTFSLSGLEAETTYSVTLVATASTGRSATRSFSFTTARWPYAMNEPSAVTDSDGSTATVSVRVDRADIAGTLVLAAGGDTVQTWSGVAAGQTYTASFPVALGLVKNYAFTIVDDDCDGIYETVANGAVLGRKTIGWFDVQLDRAGYGAWPFSPSGGLDPADGGTWATFGGENISALETVGGDRRISLATGEDGYVRYTPSEPTLSGSKVRVSGRTQLIAEYGAPEAIDPAPLAALALGKSGTVVTLYGYTGNGWAPLEGADIPSDGWIEWIADFDLGATPATVAYTVGEARLTSGGATNLPVASSSRQVSRVTYVGNGAADDFRGVYYIEEEATDRLITFNAKLRSGSENGLTFTNVGADTEKFVIGLKDAQAGLYYVAFGSTAITGKFSCVSCELASGATVDLPAASDGIPIQFFKIYGATEPVEIGADLDDLLSE